MDKSREPIQSSERSEKRIPTVSTRLRDGSLVEMLYDPRAERTAFAVWKSDQWRIELDVKNGESEILVPFSARNNLIQNDVILLPSGVEEYGTEEQLQEAVQDFIHRYVDVSPLFEKIASYYVLFSWVHDAFNELPYLRLKGDPGSGKTRFLLAVGSLCYKPIFASGASTISPLFRILDAFRGTLIIDESDFRQSDERAETVKILNNGNVKGFPVLRSEASVTGKEFNPRAYHVFGPKIVATRQFFEDRALESRFFTEDMGRRPLREDIPISIPDAHREEARRLRNKLLLFRFRNLHRSKAESGLVDRSIEPRLNQIFIPLLSIIQDEKTREDIRDLARTYNRQMVADRGLDSEAQVLESIQVLRSMGSRLSIKSISDAFAEQYGADYERKITPKWVGGVIRNKLHLRTQKSDGIYIIPDTEEPQLQRLFQRYGLAGGTTPESPASPEVHSEDFSPSLLPHPASPDVPPSPLPG